MGNSKEAAYNDGVKRGQFEGSSGEFGRVMDPLGNIAEAIAYGEDYDTYYMGLEYGWTHPKHKEKEAPANDKEEKDTKDEEAEITCDGYCTTCDDSDCEYSMCDECCNGCENDNCNEACDGCCDSCGLAEINDYDNKGINCVDCGNEFVFTAGEQDYFKKHNLSDPKRCQSCREKKKNNKRSPSKPLAPPRSRVSATTIARDGDMPEDDESDEEDTDEDD